VIPIEPATTMTTHFAMRLATDTRFAIAAAHIAAAAAFGIGMMLATVVHGLIG